MGIKEASKMMTMKTTYTLLLALSLIGIAYTTKAQTKNTTEGHSLVIDGLYLRIDTITHRTQIYNWRKGKWSRKVYISINGGKESLLPKNGVQTIWKESFELTVARKKIKKTYKI